MTLSAGAAVNSSIESFIICSYESSGAIVGFDCGSVKRIDSAESGVADSSRPLLSGCPIARLLLCKIVIAGSLVGACFAIKLATIAGNCSVVFTTSITISSVIDNVLSNALLSKLSIDQAISLILKAPTIRPAPFRE